jgi:phage tail protein X
MSTPSRIETIVVQGDDISVDLLVWRRFRDHRDGFVERVLEANPGLAELGPILPLGTEVRLPLDAPETRPLEQPVVRLWD